MADLLSIAILLIVVKPNWKHLNSPIRTLCTNLFLYIHHCFSVPNILNYFVDKYRTARADRFEAMYCPFHAKFIALSRLRTVLLMLDLVHLIRALANFACPEECSS